MYRGRRLKVEVRAREATYELLDGEPLELHDGEAGRCAARASRSRARPGAPGGAGEPGPAAGARADAHGDG